MIVYSPAKINIGLRVLNKREDHYHNLHSYFYPVPLYDLIEFIPAEEDSLFQSGFVSTSQMQDNLVYKALLLLREFIEVPPLKIHLHKQIPFQAGLGGGSGDAMSFIKLVADHFNIVLNAQKWQTIAEKLGSDCPFFIKALPAEVSGRGEMIKTLNWSLKGVYIVIVKPDISVSTADAFEHIIPEQQALPNILLYNFDQYQEHFNNQFEDYLMVKYPQLKEIKTRLHTSGAFYVSLSGSGSSVFGLFYNDVKINMPSSYFVWKTPLK